MVRRASGRTKTEARNKLRDLMRDRDDGLVVANDGYTVKQAVEDWLEFGLTNRDPATREKNRILCNEARDPAAGRAEAPRSEGDRGRAVADQAVGDLEHQDAAGASALASTER